MAYSMPQWMFGNVTTDTPVRDHDTMAELVDRYACLVEEVAGELTPLLLLPEGIEQFDVEHAGYDGLICLAERVGDGPGFPELAKWAIRSAITDFVKTVSET